MSTYIYACLNAHTQVCTDNYESLIEHKHARTICMHLPTILIISTEGDKTSNEIL